MLAPIARKACEMEDSDPQSKGEFLKMLCICAELSEDKIQILFEYILDELSESELLESCEFHEGLDELLEPSRMVEIVVGAYARVSTNELSRVFALMCSSGTLKPDSACWRIIRSNLSPFECRVLLSKIIEQTCDRLDQISDLLESVFGEDEFEIADSIRLVLESHWILDILPQKRKKARRTVEEFLLKPFPFAKQYIDTFLIETLGFEDITPVAGDRRDGSSSDSDIESRGSLDDFVVDDSIDESDASSLSSESVLPAPKVRKISRHSSNH